MSLRGLKSKFNKLIGRDTKEEKDKKLSEGLALNEKLIAQFCSYFSIGETGLEELKKLAQKNNVGDSKNKLNERELFAYEVLEFLKYQEGDSANITESENKIKDTNINNDAEYEQLINGMIKLISEISSKKGLKSLASSEGGSTPQASSDQASTATGQPSESELPPPPLNTDMKQTRSPKRLPPTPLPQNFSDPECQKQVIEKFLKNRLSGLIKQVKMWGFLDDNYNYDENIYCSFDYPSCKFLENVRVFWLKIAKIIYGGIKKIPSNDISYEIINFQNRIGNCLPRTEMQSLLSTDDFVKKSNSFLDYISEKIGGIGSKNLLETKKSELIKSKDDTLNKLVSKYNELYEDDQHRQFENGSLDELQLTIKMFWQALEVKLNRGTKKEKERAKRLNGSMVNFDSDIEANKEMDTYKAINYVGELLDQELNIIGRVILYLEKRKNKENEKGFFGKLFGKSKKSNDETKSDESNKSKEELKKEKKQKKEKLNNQKRLKKCFEDMGKYFVKHKKEDKVKLSDFKKLVKGKDPYATWSTDLGNTVLGDTNITKSENGKIEKKLLMGLLFLSLIDLGDKESVIAACDGLKAGGIKSNDTKLFEGKATSIRKAIKGKCSIDIRKDDLGDYIASLCGKYDLVEKTQANLITFKFVNEWKNESSSADTPEA